MRPSSHSECRRITLANSERSAPTRSRATSRSSSRTAAADRAQDGNGISSASESLTVPIGWPASSRTRMTKSPFPSPWTRRSAISAAVIIASSRAALAFLQASCPAALASPSTPRRSCERLSSRSGNSVRCWPTLSSISGADAGRRVAFRGEPPRLRRPHGQAFLAIVAEGPLTRRVVQA